MKKVFGIFVKIALVLLAIKLETYVWSKNCTFDSSLVYALSFIGLAVIVYILLGVKLPQYNKDIKIYRKK